MTAFHAEERFRSSTSRAPDSVMAFAAPAGFRRPITDLARLTGKLEEERQSDRERARYHRMQDKETALLAVAAAGDYDSDD